MTDISEPRVTPRWPLRRALVAIALALLVAVGGLTFWGWSYNYAVSAATALTDAKTAAAETQKEADKAAAAIARTAARAEAERSAQESEDAFYKGWGYESAGDGLYMRWVDTSDFTCGYWSCAYVEVMAVDGCPSNMYVEAAITNGGADIGFANHMAAGVERGGTVMALLEDHSGTGDGFRVTKVNCY
jgi:hypothetical protein